MRNSLRNILTAGALALATACTGEKTLGKGEYLYGTFRNFDVQANKLSNGQRWVQISRPGFVSGLPHSVIGYDINLDNVFGEISVASGLVREDETNLAPYKNDVLLTYNSDSLRAAYDSAFAQTERRNKQKGKK